MIPRPHSINSQSQARDLASSVLSSSSPQQISSAISSAESLLHKLSPDQSRAFFSLSFPAIICRLFGFDESSPSAAWIDQGYSNPDLSARLFAFLSPNGPLFAAIFSADRLNLVKYVFPPERLPEWMRNALQSERQFSILADICPLFRNRVKEEQLQLNAFEYHMFWFAYYPVCRGNSRKSSDDGLEVNGWRKSRFLLPGFVNSGGRRSGQKSEASLYVKLLYSYLCSFVPKCGLGAQAPYRSSLLHYSSSFDVSVFERAEFFVYVLVHFWLVDNDFSPLGMSVCRSFVVETPPTAGLGEMVKLFVKYLNFSLVVPAEGDNKKVMLSDWNLVVQRSLYRFILRTFLFCPIAASLKNVDQILSVWVTYLVPWRTKAEDFVEFEPPTVNKLGTLKKKVVLGKIIGENEICHTVDVYSDVWEGYVASNYLFYSSLVVHFLGFAHKFLHANVEMVVDMMLKVLNILTSSKELIDLLRKIDTAYHSKQSRLYTHIDVDKYIPSIRQQLKDWEDGLCESDTDGSFLHDNWNQDLKLFSDGEDGALKLLQLFIIRAEHEIHSMSCDNMRSLHTLDSIKSLMSILFDVPITPQPHLPNSNSIGELPCLRRGREDVFTPKHPGFVAAKWADVKYKGDWMHRPISDTEVAWLARLLIRFSDWLNESVGLDHVESGSEPCMPAFVELASGDLSFEGGPKEVAAMLSNLVASRLGRFGHSVVSFMRGHGMRINLRLFSSKKFFMFLIIYVIVYALKKACNKAAAWALADQGKPTRNHT